MKINKKGPSLGGWQCCQVEAHRKMQVVIPVGSLTVNEKAFLFLPPCQPRIRRVTDFPKAASGFQVYGLDIQATVISNSHDITTRLWSHSTDLANVSVDLRMASQALEFHNRLKRQLRHVSRAQPKLTSSQHSRQLHVEPLNTVTKYNRSKHSIITRLFFQTYHGHWSSDFPPPFRWRLQMFPHLWHAFLLAAPWDVPEDSAYLHLWITIASFEYIIPLVVFGIFDPRPTRACICR
mmetsp:Transcript_151135/g.289662  ORF Transcript_151135/g.289662 Transcript_151135/m.289662 type:complete len:236 (+) Transcript_151135:403-1110(+)